MLQWGALVKQFCRSTELLWINKSKLRLYPWEIDGSNRSFDLVETNKDQKCTKNIFSNTSNRCFEDTTHVGGGGLLQGIFRGIPLHGGKSS